MKIVDNRIWRDGEKMGRLDGPHIRDYHDNKLGYFENNIIYNEAAHKIAYIHENQLMFYNGQPSISLDHINAEIEGTVPLIDKCAVHVLFQD